MLRKTILLGLLFVAVPVTILADQAAWIGKSDAYKAGQMINPGTVLRKYCAPCGDSAWTPLTVRKVEVKHKNGDYYQVEINGQGTDLAYVYIEQKGKWVSLAMNLGLKVSGVPEFLPDQKDALVTRIHFIDKALEECIARDNSTTGMTSCTYEACKLWDAELNRVYNQLRAVLNPDAKKALKAAQLKWLKYRDSEFRLIDSIYSSLEGTMFIPMRAGDRMDIVKNRAMELESYLDLINMNNE